MRYWRLGRGFGLILGDALRRVLLSSLQDVAVTLPENIEDMAKKLEQEIMG